MKKLLLAAIVALTAMPAGAEVRSFDFRYYVSSGADTSLVGTYQYGRFSYDDQILPVYVDLANRSELFVDSSITIGLLGSDGYDDQCGTTCSMSINGSAVATNGQPIFGVSVIGSFGQRTFDYYGGTVGFNGLAVPTGFTNLEDPAATYNGLVELAASGQPLTASSLPPSYALFSYGPVIIAGEPTNGRTGGFAQFVEAAAPVPEPGVWAMLASGLAMVGGAARRRPRK